MHNLLFIYLFQHIYTGYNKFSKAIFNKTRNNHGQLITVVNEISWTFVQKSICFNTTCDDLWMLVFHEIKDFYHGRWPPPGNLPAKMNDGQYFSLLHILIHFMQMFYHTINQCKKGPWYLLVNLKLIIFAKGTSISLRGHPEHAYN